MVTGDPETWQTEKEITALLELYLTYFETTIFQMLSFQQPTIH